MQKTKMIKEIIGTAIKPYGFQYWKTDGPSRVFIKRLEGVKRYFDPEVTTAELYINIQDSNVAKALYVRLSSNVAAKVNHSELEEAYDGRPWMPYTDEESFRKCLKRIAELLIEYGLPMLEEMSVEEEVITTRAMEERLYQEYPSLEQKFIEQYHLKTVAESEADIDEWFERIREILLDTCDRPYEEVKELILMVAAFWQQRFCELLGAECEHDERIHITAVTCKYGYFPSLGPIVYQWKNKCDENSMTGSKYCRDLMKDIFAGRR
ncbi:MAG: hypothetical protein IJ716_13190 [Lachnospiraceae bacterium]|nr:hypothetical protein [Lachnospiraceae bacterium]